MGNVTLCAECSSSSKMKLRLHIFGYIFFHMVLKAKTKQNLLHFSQLSLHCLFIFLVLKNIWKKWATAVWKLKPNYIEQLKCKPESNQDEIHFYLNHECICFHSTKNIWNLLNGFSQTSKSRTKRGCHAFFPNIIPNIISWLNYQVK